MVTYKKGEATKILDEDSKIIATLIKDGWELVEKEAPKKAKKSDEK